MNLPTDTKDYPAIILSSVALMTDDEKEMLDKYTSCGGVVIVCGPSALGCCNSKWVLPTKPHIEEPNDFFSTIANGVWHKSADWITKTSLEESSEPNQWTEVADRVYYNPHRISDGKISDTLLGIVSKFAKKMPIELVSADGYMVTVFESEDSYIMHFLASDYDTDIDHELDEMRFHRSRVNFVNKVTPKGVTDTLKIVSGNLPQVYIPFSKSMSEITLADGICTVSLPKDTAYVILRFEKKKTK